MMSEDKTYEHENKGKQREQREDQLELASVSRESCSHYNSNQREGQCDEGEEPQRVGGGAVLLESLRHHKGKRNSVC